MSTETRIDPAEWPAVVADTEGPQLIVAGPGAGKTEFLVRRAAHLVDASGLRPDEILVLSFSRRTVADLRRRLGRALARSVAGIPASTFHSLAMRLVEAHAPDVLGWTHLPTLLTGPEQVALVADLLADEEPAAWPLAFRGLLGSPAFATEVTDFVLRCREHLIDPDELARRSRDRDDWDGLAAFLDRYGDALRDRGRIDYGSLQAAAVDVLADAGVATAVADRFRYVLVDEYQDTTVAQAALLKALTARDRHLTVAGDPYQSIYSFRGAAVDNIARFPDEFRTIDGAPARRIVLTTSFRVPAEILDAAVRVTAGGRLPGAAGPVVPARGSGSVEVRRFDQQTHEAEWIAAQVERWHRLDGIPYAAMAVLVRSTRRLLPELSRALGRRGIPHEEPDRRLVDHPAARIVFDLVRAAEGRHPADRLRAFRRLLLGPLGTMPLGAWRDLERRVAADGDWDAALREAGHVEIAELVTDAAWATDLPAAEGFWHAWSSIPAFVPVAEADRSLRSAWASLGQVLGRLRERDASTSLARFLAWSEAEDFEATPLLEFSGADADRLTLTTLHQAKGRAFDIVVIADAVEGVFPDLRRRETLLQVRHLATHHPKDAASWAAFRLQEEMRLAYTAMTRAARRVVWTTTAGGDETGAGAPSRFIGMIFGQVPEIGPDSDREPVTPVEAEAWLQRIARDPLEPA
ncbi:MAG TPA: ATP-dependent helicase, partial [Acidimicrobiia bacterium]|nr:ATP-dependent helicase [Acidimicrobiia bacterium]